MAYFQDNIKINLYNVYQGISYIHESHLIKKKSQNNKERLLVSFFGVGNISNCLYKIHPIKPDALTGLLCFTAGATEDITLDH